MSTASTSRTLACLALALLTGCPSGPAERTGAPPTVDLVIVDARPDATNVRPAPYVDTTYWIPVIPWYTAESEHHLHLSWLPEIRKTLRDAGHASKVLGADHPASERLAADYELRVTLEETRATRTRTCYCVGFAAIGLHLLLPSDFASARVRLRASLIPRRDDRQPRGGEGSASVRDVLWLYSDYKPIPSMTQALREALLEALEDTR